MGSDAKISVPALEKAERVLSNPDPWVNIAGRQAAGTALPALLAVLRAANVYVDLIPEDDGYEEAEAALMAALDAFTFEE